MAVWAYISVRGEYWGGVCVIKDLSGVCVNNDRKAIARWLAKFVASGFEIVSVANWDEYNQELALLKPHSESPEHQMKYARKSGSAA